MNQQLHIHRPDQASRIFLFDEVFTKVAEAQSKALADENSRLESEIDKIDSEIRDLQR